VTFPPRLFFASGDTSHAVHPAREFNVAEGNRCHWQIALDTVLLVSKRIAMKQASIRDHVLAPELLRDAVTRLVASATVAVVSETAAHDVVLVVAGSDWPRRLARFRERHGKSSQPMLLLAQPGDLHLEQVSASGFRVLLGWDDRDCLELALQAAASGNSFCSVSLLTPPVPPGRESPAFDVRARLGQLSQHFALCCDWCCAG